MSSAGKKGGAGGIALGYGVHIERSRNTLKADFWAELERVKDVFEQSTTMNVAFEAIVDEILRPGLYQIGDTTKPANPIEYVFVTDILKNLVMYGYSTYKQVDVSGEKIYQVPDGAEVSIKFNNKKNKWVADKKNKYDAFKPDNQNSKSGNFFNEDGENGDDEELQIVILSPPTEFGPVSFAHRTLPEALRMERFMHYMELRDIHNSARECFVTVDNNAIATSNTGMPWMSSSVPSGAALAMGDYNSLVENRVEMLRQLKESTQMRRAESGAMGTVGLGLRTNMRSQAHIEMDITDGHRADEAAHMRGREAELQFMMRLGHRVLQSMGVPPQQIGETPSAERAAGAERSTGAAIEAFASRCKHFRVVIEPALAVAGLRFGNVTRADAFERLFPLVTTDAAIEMMSGLFQVEPGLFDREAVEEMQTLKRSMGARGDAVKNEAEPKKRQKTNYEKQVTIEQKAQPAV